MRGNDRFCIFLNIVDMRLFAEINGPRVSETLLKNMGSLAKTFFPQAQISCENNESFCVLTRDDAVEERIERVAKGMRLLGGFSPVLIKAGIYCIPRDQDPPKEELLRYVRLAESFIHNEDGVLFRYYDEELEHILADRDYVKKHLQDAILDGEIKVFYQPIVRTLNGKAVAYEALTRWENPKLGFLSPKEFISAIEESRQINILDSYMIKQICKDLRDGLDEGMQIQPVSFNLSRLDFHLSDVFAFVENAVKEYRIDRSFINLEITEKIVAESEMIRMQIRRFTEAGYKVWMDDFGRGYSSLNTLKQYDFDKLKIDMSSPAFNNEKSKEIIIATVAAAKRMGIRTLAESVETSEQYEFLRSIGCEEVQGYYISKPLPLKEIGPLLQPRGILPESEEDGLLFNEAGREDITDKVPCTLMMFEQDHFAPLFENRPCKKLMAEVFGPDQSLSDMMNDPGDVFYQLIRDRIELCREQSRNDFFVFQGRQGTFMFQLKILAEQNEKMILKIAVGRADLVEMISGN